MTWVNAELASNPLRYVLIAATLAFFLGILVGSL